MKTLSLTLIILVLGQMLKAPVHAQSADTNDVTRYDSKLEKRADLRIKFTEAQHKAPAAAAAAKTQPDGAAKQPERKQHPDNSKMVDFMSRSAKRAGLRIRTSQLGFEQSYAEWRQREGGG